MNVLKKNVLWDCSRAIAPAVVFNISDAILGACLTIYTADAFAGFTDAIFRLDFSYGMANFSKIMICVAISLFILPMFGTGKEIMLFQNSLKHDRMIYGRYMNKKFKEAQQFSEGEIQYRLEQDAIDLRCMWLAIVTNYFSIPITLAYLLFNTIRISPVYTIIIVFVSAIKISVPIVTKKLNASYDRENRTYREQVRSYETEIMRQPHKVKLYGLTEPLLERLNKLYLHYFHETYRKNVRFSALTSNITSMLDIFCTMFILLSGAVLVANNSISAGNMAGAFGYYAVFTTLFTNISSVIRDTPILRNLIDRLTIFYSDEEVTSGKPLSAVEQITIRDLSFSYEDTTVLSKVNINIHKGDKVVVCGQNGSGKSTFIKLLCGLLKDYYGHIELDGTELSEFSVRNWYNYFAYTEQDPHLFSVSVRENIHIGNLMASEKELDDIIRELGIEYLADRDIHEENNQLSGGEKHKISIARALIKNTPIIIMDEPSNNLDVNTTRWLKEFISKSSKTIIYVSHDQALIDCADYILHL